MAAFPIRTGDIDEIMLQQNGPLTKLYKVTVPNTTIVNRAQAVDPSRDLLPRFGLSRVMTQYIQEIQGEFGANGERVWKPLNDVTDQVRFVGSWFNVTDYNGTRPQSFAATDYIEIVFYGTGLNILCYVDTNNRGFNASVDGGTATAINVTGLATLSARYYSSNTVFNVASNLTLGLHTVKLTCLNTNGSAFFGYEVVGPTTLNLLPGTSYNGARKLTKPALNTDSYNSNFESGTLGTKGGNVLVYQKFDGTIGKAVTPTDPTALYLTATNHVNEDPLRPFNSYREFGASTYEFAYAAGSNQSAAFTLDDGTTTLVAYQVDFLPAGNGIDSIRPNAVGSYVAITFVGTGLDLLCSASAANFDAHSVTIDNVVVGSVSSLPAGGPYSIIKIASGLPYGSHTVKVQRTVSSVTGLYFCRFLPYGPKKPTLPAGAVEQANYYLLGNYVPLTTAASSSPPSQGTIRKVGMRETLYTGTWGAIGLDNGFGSGYNINTTTAASTASQIFFGIGVEWRFYTSTSAAANFSVVITNLATGAAVTLAAGNVAIAQAGTGLVVTPGATTTITGTPSANSYGTGLQITGLALGLYKITITQNTTSVAMYSDSFDIITPVHSPKFISPGDLQNTLPVGNCAIGDSRKFAVQSVKAPSNWVQAFGVVSGPSTSSTTQVPFPDMLVSLTTSGNPIEISYSNTSNNSVANNETRFQVYVDGVPVGIEQVVTTPSATVNMPCSDNMIVPVPAGKHDVQLFWRASSGSSTGRLTLRNIKAREI